MRKIKRLLLTASIVFVVLITILIKNMNKLPSDLRSAEYNKEQIKLKELVKGVKDTEYTLLVTKLEENSDQYK